MSEWLLPVWTVLTQVEREPVLSYPSVMDLFLRGGPVMFIILLLSILGLFFWLRGFLLAWSVRKELPRGETLLRMAEAGSFTSLRDAAKAGDSLTDRIAERLLSFAQDPASELRQEAQEVLAAHLYATLKTTRWVSICARLAPLLGLLGTVVGISITFSDVALAGSGDYAQLADGIHQALYTTIFGLGVALVLTILGALLNGRVVALEHAAGRFTDALIVCVKQREGDHGA